MSDDANRFRKKADEAREQAGHKPSRQRSVAACCRGLVKARGVRRRATRSVIVDYRRLRNLHDGRRLSESLTFSQ
jgi:hypothetical protein